MTIGIESDGKGRRSTVVPITFPPRLLARIRESAAESEQSLAAWIRDAARRKLAATAPAPKP